MTKYSTNLNRRVECPKCGHHFTPHTAAMQTLTPKQNAVLGYLRDYVGQKGYAPSFAEIATALGYTSFATVHEHLTTLERKGYILRSYNEVRAITLIDGEADELFKAKFPDVEPDYNAQLGEGA